MFIVGHAIVNVSAEKPNMLSEAIPVGAAAKVDQPVFAVVDDNVCDGLTTLYKSVVTARRTIDDNFESEEEYKKPLARSQADTEVNDVMERIYRMHREKDVVETSRLVMNVEYQEKRGTGIATWMFTMTRESRTIRVLRERWYTARM